MHWIRALYQINTAFRWESQRFPKLFFFLKRIDYCISILIHTLNLLILIIVYILLLIPMKFLLKSRSNELTFRKKSDPLRENHFMTPY